MIVIACPSCQSRLRLPDSLLGQTVRCPRCQRDFQAQPGLEVREPAAAVPPGGPPRPDSPAAGVTFEDEEDDRPPGDVPCPYCGERMAAGSRHCRFCGNPLDLGAGSPRLRRDAEPHRGGLIQALGIASVILGSLAFATCGLTAPLGLPLGIAAWALANRDLPRMRAGEMDPEGLAPTLTGRQCGLLGIVFSLLCGLGAGGLAWFALMT